MPAWILLLARSEAYHAPVLLQLLQYLVNLRRLLRSERQLHGVEALRRRSIHDGSVDFAERLPDLARGSLLVEGYDDFRLCFCAGIGTGRAGGGIVGWLLNHARMVVLIERHRAYRQQQRELCCHSEACEDRSGRPPVLAERSEAVAKVSRFRRRPAFGLGAPALVVFNLGQRAIQQKRGRVRRLVAHGDHSFAHGGQATHLTRALRAALQVRGHNGFLLAANVAFTYHGSSSIISWWFIAIPL